MAGRILQFSRNFTQIAPNLTTRRLLASLAEPLKEVPKSHNHEDTIKLWKKVFYFVCCPTILICAISIALEEEHPRPEFKKYEHLRIRNKKYPWRDGVKTLFHNPHTNALPDGYEAVEEHH